MLANSTQTHKTQKVAKMVRMRMRMRKHLIAIIHFWRSLLGRDEVRMEGMEVTKPPRLEGMARMWATQHTLLTVLPVRTLLMLSKMEQELKDTLFYLLTSCVQGFRHLTRKADKLCPRIHLQEDMWRDHGCVSAADDSELIKEFSMTELEQAVREMKTDTAQGPDGFSTLFLKEFWEQCKVDILEMLNDLHKENLNLARLNYGVIALIPKVKEAVNIKQYRPICLLNVVYKIITKVLTVRLSKVAAKIVGESQNGFYSGQIYFGWSGGTT